MYFVMGIFRQEKGQNFIVPRLQVLKDEQLFAHQEFEDFAMYYLEEMVDVPFEILSPEDQAKSIQSYCSSRDGLFVQFAPESKDVPTALEILKAQYIEVCQKLIAQK